MICEQCLKSLSIAMELRTTTRRSESYFKRSKKKEVSRWQNELDILLDDNFNVKNETVEVIKTEPSFLINYDDDDNDNGCDTFIQDDFESDDTNEIKKSKKSKKISIKKQGNRFKCPQCPDLLSCRKSLYYHVRVKHEFKPDHGYKCDVSYLNLFFIKNFNYTFVLSNVDVNMHLNTP